MKSRLHHAPRCDSMKCVQRKADGTIKRVRTEAADKMVATGDFHYVCKQKWRAQRSADNA